MSERSTKETQALYAVGHVTPIQSDASLIEELRSQVGALGFENERLKKENARLEDLALHDPLTGLYNRRFLEIQMRREFGRIRRGDIGSVALMYIDLDDFKEVNTRHGHAGGDEVLNAVANAMQHNIRPGDTIIRIGGDEFVAILPDANEIGAFRFAERFRKIIAANPARLADGTMVRVTVSIGIATHERGDDNDLPAFLAKADAGMYMAKKRPGKNRTVALGGP